jgi:hypothetical protein
MITYDPTVEPTKGELAIQRLKSLAKKGNKPWEGNSIERPSCPSSHGGVGYCVGDTGILYKSKKTGLNLRMDITCTFCRFVIKNAPPTGTRAVIYKFTENPIKYLLKIQKDVEPTWPSFISYRVKYI